jgi:hypothetical protein
MEFPYMFPAKFCSQCGEKIDRNRLRAFAFTAFCRRCKRPARYTRFALVAIFISLAVGGFFVGRATTPRQPFNLIGEPIDLQTARNSQASEPSQGPATNHEASLGKPTTGSEDEALTMCGAPTKAGRPCRRKVRGGGYCYQHKDKYKAPANATQ